MGRSGCEMSSFVDVGSVDERREVVVGGEVERFGSRGRRFGGGSRRSRSVGSGSGRRSRNGVEDGKAEILNGLVEKRVEGVCRRSGSEGGRGSPDRPQRVERGLVTSSGSP